MVDFLTRLQTALGDGYRVERELGGGGMSRVFVAQEVGLGRRVAVKVLPPEFGLAVSTERFRREIQLAASLQHPHIVPVLSAGEADGLLYYTMPLIDGETLRARLSREGRLPPRDAIRIVSDVLEALAYAHRHGVVHRDIKPENVLLANEHALVTDFGVAKALTQATDGGGLTSAGMTLGTPAYMAPEQVAADPQVDHRSDIYSTGVMAYEMLAGRSPFAGASPQRLLAAHIADEPESVMRLRPDLPPVTGSSVMRCLAKDPADRWQSADDWRRELTKDLTESSVPAVRRGGRRRWSVVALSTLAVVLAAIWAISRSRASSSPVGSAALVAVLPFSVQGSSDVSYLAEGLVHLLSTSLDGAGSLRAVDPHAVLSLVQRRGHGALDPARGAELAERLGAGLYVLGDVVEAGGRVRIGATLYDRERGSSPSARATIEGQRGEVFSLVDGLATQLLAQSSTGPTSRVTRVASVTTPSLAAYKAYLDGEAALRAGRADSALVAFQEAVALDTAFALAYYRLSVAAEWATRAPLAEQAAEQAVRHSARLADHDRRLLRALLATRRGAGFEAEGLYRDILAAYPDDIEAWIQLGEVLFHYGPTLGQSLAESRPAFERVLYFEPGYVSALVHLVRIAAFEDRASAVDSLVSVLVAASPSSDRGLEMRVLRAYASRDVGAEQRARDELARAPDAVLPLPIWDVAVYARDLDGAEAVARLLTDPGRSRDAQATGHATLAYLALARGRLGEARLEIQRTAAVDSIRGLEFGTLLELAPFVTPRRGALEAARRALERIDPAAVPPSTMPNVFFNSHDGIHDVLRAYLLGAVNARLGNMAEAGQYAVKLEREPGPPTATGLPRDLGLEVRAEVAMAQGSPAAALGFLRQRVDQSWYEYHFASPVFSGARGRYVRAGLEDDVGQAIVLFSTFEGYAAYPLMYAGPARLHRGALYERQGDSAAAAQDYAWFLDRWKGCDREFTPLLDSARAGLARVGGGAGERSRMQPITVR